MFPPSFPLSGGLHQRLAECVEKFGAEAVNLIFSVLSSEFSTSVVYETEVVKVSDGVVEELREQNSVLVIRLYRSKAKAEGP